MLAIEYPAPNKTASPTTMLTLLLGPPLNISTSVSQSKIILSGLDITLGGTLGRVAPVVSYNATQSVK
jgi:H+/Cl- antiporter ClcA